MFKTNRDYRAWNARYAGSLAGYIDKARGYRLVHLGDKYYKAHRLIWLLVYGEWPDNQIDHIDGDGANNRLDNLRQATNAENARNAKRNRKNTSGTTGVDWYKKAAKWRARVRFDGEEIVLGYFADKAEAIQARRDAEWQLGFHPNHGRAP